MRQRKSWVLLTAAWTVIVGALLSTPGSWAADKFKVLHAFTWAKTPFGNLTLDAAGNFYGTTEGGGGSACNGCGVVWKLKPNSNGTWTVSILHVFKSEEGAHPYAGLVFDGAGNLYGTTANYGSYGHGAVFRLRPNIDGTWTESVLHSFAGPDGDTPYAGLIFDTAGNLYGTTTAGGAEGYGVVFKLKPNIDGTWTESMIYSFADGADGGYPGAAGLVLDGSGNLYGTTSSGGTGGYGVVFELKRNMDGTWTESVLHRFTLVDGAYPYAAPVFDAAGNLYGTTLNGGVAGAGVVFKLTPNQNGTWTESVLYSFTGGADGGVPYAGLIFDTAGNLYGTTTTGGPEGYGVVFKLKLTSSGWSETILHSFVGYGKTPYAPLILDLAGNLYGTTSDGNHAFDYGLVFEISP